MGEFKIIESQEQLDEIIKGRLDRNTKSVEEKFAGFISPEELNKKIAGIEEEKTKLANALTAEQEKSKESEAKIEELSKKVSDYEIASVKTRVANELGIDLALAERLNGTNEDEIRKDAQSLAGLVNKQSQPPAYNPNPADDNEDQAKRAEEISVLRQLRGNE